MLAVVLKSALQSRGVLLSSRLHWKAVRAVFWSAGVDDRVTISAGSSSTGFPPAETSICSNTSHDWQGRSGRGGAPRPRSDVPAVENCWWSRP